MRNFAADLQIKSLDDDERVIEGIASTDTKDRMGDIVMPMGARFKLPLPLLLDHAHHDAVGSVEWASVSKAGIKFRARIPKIPEMGAARDLVDRAWHLAKHGLRRSVSIGFTPIRAEPLPSGGFRYLEWSWIELSLVAVPAQADADILATRAARKAPLTVAQARAVYDRLTAPQTEHRVTLKASDVARGRIIREAAERAETRKANGQDDRAHVSTITTEAAERRARIEAARAELYARQLRTGR